LPANKAAMSRFPAWARQHRDSTNGLLRPIGADRNTRHKQKLPIAMRESIAMPASPRAAA